MKNTGGGYLVAGVEDKTWQPLGLSESFSLDTKELRDAVRKATGLDLDVDIVTHRLYINGQRRLFAVILVRSTAKRHKLRSPSRCIISFHASRKWGIRQGDIYFRKGDSTVRLTSRKDLLELLDDLIERQDQAALESETAMPSPFEIETGLYRLLPREYERFIGRQELRKDARKAIEKDPRIWIVNLYGPGGVGKSALARWLAHEYYQERKFEAVLQLSAKNRKLTEKGIQRVRPTLYSIGNLVDNILRLFGFSEYLDRTLEDRKEITSMLLQDYSMLLILDNMETVQDGRIMEFVRSLSPDSQAKVLLTSRMRSHGWEMPVRVDELTETEVREFAQAKAEEMNLGTIRDVGGIFDRIHRASGGLPLAIQWILAQYSITGDWDTVTERVSGSDSPLLEFSFRNLWNFLSERSRKALAVLSIFDEPPTLHLWATALDWSRQYIEQAAEDLEEKTFISKKVTPETGKETYHALPITLQFAANELCKMGNLEISARTNYQRYVQEMELVAAETERYSFLFNKFHVERDTEKKAIILARKAEAEANALNYSEAERLYQRALKVDPRSVYVLVQYALLKLSIGEIGHAIDLMEEATSRCDRRTGFFVYYNFSKVYDETRDRHNVERCLRKALEYNPEHPIARHQLGVVISRLGRFEEAIQIFDDLISDELKRSRPSDTLVYAYKTKLINLEKAKRESEIPTVLEEAKEEINKWPHLRGRVHDLENAVAV
jgi:tetratricopeptide (TPR) repeat protein